jgi:hypothetical protein
MDTLDIAVTLVSLAIFAVALYESFTVSKLTGKLPAFWTFFIAAIVFLIFRRIVVLLADTIISIPTYWSTLDGDATLIIFSALFLMFVLEMKKSFQRASKAQGESESAAPEQV